jgi:glutaconate CoA-transferase subunit B
MTCNYSATELMAIVASRFVEDGDVLFAGTGVATLAACAGRRLRAKDAPLFFETGGIDPALRELPLAVADLRVMSESIVNADLLGAFSLIGHRKIRTLAFLGAAQVDPYGNLNSTTLGDYRSPSRRFSGSGGAADAAALASATIVFMKHERRRFVEELDYITSVGWHRGGQSRSELGYVRGGPIAVITNLAVLGFDAVTKRMKLVSYHPGQSPTSVAEATGFDLNRDGALETTLPLPSELAILRDEIDPDRLLLGALDS